MAFPVTLNGRTYTLTDFEGTNYVDGLPDAFEDFVTHAGDIYNSTSTTSNSIGTGSKTFTVEANKPYQAGTPLRIADAAAPSTNFLDTVVTSYSGTTLVVNSIGFGGSGTKTSWTVNIGGAKTVDGTLGVSQGGTGATTAAAAASNLGVGTEDSPSFSGLTVNDDLLLVQATDATSGNTIVRVQGGTSGFSQIHFSDADDTNAGRITFDHSSNEMQFFNTAQNFTMDTNGNTKFGAISGITVTGLSSGNNLIAGSSSGAEIVAYNSLNAISLGDFVGAFLFGNDDNNTTEDHFAGMWAKSAGTTGAMDIHFAAGKAEYEADTPHMTLDYNGRFLIGTTASNTTISANPALQVASTEYSGSMIGVYRYSNDGPTPSHFTMSKSRGTSVNTQAVVQDDDKLGSVNFAGSDGTNFVHAATIEGLSDGTPGSNDMPGRLVFSTTADGASSSSERLTINRSGEIIAAGGGTGYGGFIIQPGANGKVTTGMVSGSDTQSFVTFNLSSAFVSMTAIEFTVMQRRNASGGYNQIDNGKFGIFVSNRNDNNSAWKVELLTYGSSYSSATISDSYANKTITVTLTSAHSLTTSPDITLVTASRSLYG